MSTSRGRKIRKALAWVDKENAVNHESWPGQEAAMGCYDMTMVLGATRSGLDWERGFVYSFEAFKYELCEIALENAIWLVGHGDRPRDKRSTRRGVPKTGGV